jgi:methionyl-tRNA formyltransferase
MYRNIYGNMKITILTDNLNSWILPYVEDLKKSLIINHKIHHLSKPTDIIGGDIMFILSCEKILKPKYLKIPISLFEAVEKVDAGDVYMVDYIKLKGHELNNEIKHQQGLITIKMVKKYIDEFESIVGTPQNGKETFYPRRGQKENELDINKTILEQFNLLRIVDNERYPAYFYINGNKYTLKISKD